MSQFLYRHHFPSQSFYINKVHQILHSQRPLFDIMCNYAVTDSPLLENMASLKRLLKLTKESKHKRKVNFLH